MIHGSIAVFFIGILEEVIFILPSALVFLGAGFLLIPPEINFLEAFGVAFVKIGIPASLGVTIGSLFIYGIVYFGGKRVVNKYGKYFGLTWHDVEEASKKFTSGWGDEILLFAFRALPVFPISVISAACGFIRLSWKEFVTMTFLGAFVRAGSSALIGWGVGKEYVKYAAQFENVEKYGLIVLVLGLLGVYLVLKNRLQK